MNSRITQNNMTRVNKLYISIYTTLNNIYVQTIPRCATRKTPRLPTFHTTITKINIRSSTRHVGRIPPDTPCYDTIENTRGLLPWHLNQGKNNMSQSENIGKAET